MRLRYFPDAFPNGLSNGNTGSSNMTPDIQAPRMLNYAEMDWVGASTFGSYSTFSTSDQAQGERLVLSCIECSSTSFTEHQRFLPAGPSNNNPLFPTSGDSIFGMFRVQDASGMPEKQYNGPLQYLGDWADVLASLYFPGLPAARQFVMPTPAYANYGPTPHIAGSSSLPGDSASNLSMDGKAFLNKGSAPFSNLPPAPTPSTSTLASQNPGNYNITNGTCQSEQPPSASTTTTPSLAATQPQLHSTSVAGSSSIMSSLPQTLPDEAFFNLFWPNWPNSLPSPKLVYSLCDIFFSKKWLCEGIVNRDKFFKGLACPPHHQSFPHVSLIHAICAIATKFIKPEGEFSLNLWAFYILAGMTLD